MSATTTTTTTKSNNPAPDAWIVSAGDLIAQQARVLADAKRMEHSAYQITSAILMAMAAHEGFVPAVVETGKNAGKDIGTDITTKSLMACDGDRSINGSLGLYNAASMFVSKRLQCGMQTANDIVVFTARLMRAGYTLADFNGTFVETDGRVTLEMHDYDANMPQHLIPGMFRIKPVHVAHDNTTGFFADATLARMVKATVNGVDVEVPAASDVQELCVMDRQFVFLVGNPDKDGARKSIRVRVGRNTVMKVIDAALKAEKQRAEDTAKQAREASVTPPPAPTSANGPANPARGEGEDEPARTPPASPATPPAPATVTPADATGGVNTVPANHEPVTPAGTTASVPVTPTNGNASPTGDSERRVNEEQKREEAQKLTNALTPDKLVEHARTMFVAPRMKDDPIVRKQAVLLFAHLHGILSTLGYAKIVANPTADAIRDMEVTPPAKKPAARK